MAVVSMSLPERLVQEMDGAIRDGDYKGRSEFMRAAVRTHLQETRPVGTGHLHGSITLTYPHGQEARISDARHAFHDVVLSLMHTHCEPETCMDVILVGGAAHRIQELQESLVRMKEVHRSRLVVMR